MFFLSLICLLSSINLAHFERILCVFPTPSIQRTIYQTLSVELSLRGHLVTVITANPLNDESLTNLTEIEISTLNDIEKRNRYQMDRIAKSTYVMSRLFYAEQYFMNFAEEVVSHLDTIFPGSGTDFDLVIVENVHHLIYSLGCRFQVPIVGVSSRFVPFFDNGLDLPTHSSTYLDFNYLESDEQTRNAVFRTTSKILHRWYFLYHTNKKLWHYFGSDCPHIGTLLTNISLLLTYTSSILEPTRTRVPFHVNIDGTLAVRPKQILSEDVRSFLEEASKGVIYVSLCDHIPENISSIVNLTLEELPYSVVWQFQDNWSNFGKNIIVKTFLPQQEILAHSKVKAFVTCGDQQSIEEAVINNVPLVVIPFAFDHFLQLKKIVDLGIAESLHHTNLTKDRLRDVIIEVAENQKYKEILRNVKASGPMTSLEESVWWIEYVMHHRGANHLRSPTDVSWFEYFLIDQIMVYLVTLLVIIFSVVLCKKMLYPLVFNTEKPKIN